MVSIITPTYNRAGLIGDTIRSVLAQTYTDFEWIIADDGSEDNTENLVKSFGDTRIKYLRLPHSGCLPRIRNRAIDLSKGSYLAFLDSDDQWKPGMLSEALSLLEINKEAGFVIADAEIVQEGKILYPSIYSEVHKRKSGERLYKKLFTDKLFVIFPSTLVVRRQALERNGLFDEKLRFGEKDLFTRLAYHHNGIITQQVLATIRRHGGNESASVKKGSLAEESFKEELYTLDYFLEKGYIDSKFHQRMSAVYFFKLAEFYYRGRYFREANASYRASLSRDFFNPKGVVKYLLSAIKK